MDRASGICLPGPLPTASATGRELRSPPIVRAGSQHDS